MKYFRLVCYQFIISHCIMIILTWQSSDNITTISYKQGFKRKPFQRKFNEPHMLQHYSWPRCFPPLIASNLYICEVHACNKERFDVQSCFKSTARGAAADSRTESGGPGSGFSVTWNNWKCKFSKHLKQTWNMQTCIDIRNIKSHEKQQQPWVR